MRENETDYDGCGFDNVNSNDDYLIPMYKCIKCGFKISGYIVNAEDNFNYCPGCGRKILWGERQ